MTYTVMLETSKEKKELDSGSEFAPMIESWGRFKRATEVSLRNDPSPIDTYVSLYEGTTLLQRRIFKGAKK